MSRDVLLHGDGDLVQNLQEAAINILSNDAVCITEWCASVDVHVG